MSLPSINKLQYAVPANLLKKKGYYLYQITNNFDDKVYVGYAHKIRSRIVTHARCMKKGMYDGGGRSYLYASAKAHGRENFTYTLLAVLDSFEAMETAEVALIAKYKADGFTVYNMTEGGRGVGSGENHPLYGKPRAEETRAKISKSLVGGNSPMYGKTRTAETRAKMSVSKTKYPPELIASYATKREAIAATGMLGSTYCNIRKNHPHLNWPAPGKRGRPKKSQQ